MNELGPRCGELTAVNGTWQTHPKACGLVDGCNWRYRNGPMTVLNRVQCAADAGSRLWGRVDEGAITIEELSDYMAAFFKAAEG